MIEQTERRGARPPGLEPDVRKKKASLAIQVFFQDQKLV